MNALTAGNGSAKGHQLARSLAPHVDPGWAEDFVLELRLLGVDGAQIGAALTEVESHCAEGSEAAQNAAGAHVPESAQEAFGDPAEYARRLDLPIHPDQLPGGMLRIVAPTIVQVLGFFVLLWSFVPWRQGGSVELTAGQVVAMLIFLALVAAVVRFSGPVLRAVVHHSVFTWVVAMVVMAAVGLSTELLDEVIVRVEPVPGLAVGAGALAAGLIWEVVRKRADASPDGPVTSPLGRPGAEASTSGTGQRLLGSPLFGPVTSLSMFALVLAGTWWLTR